LIDEIVREGARRMLAAALEAEVAAYIAAHAGELDERGRRLVVRNGHAVPRPTLASQTWQRRSPDVDPVSSISGNLVDAFAVLSYAGTLAVIVERCEKGTTDGQCRCPEPAAPTAGPARPTPAPRSAGACDIRRRDPLPARRRARRTATFGMDHLAMGRTWWKDLSPRAQAGILIMASVQLSLTATAVADLATRPTGLTRGPKALWWVAVFVPPIGPPAYLLWGRGRTTTARCRV
jgi:Phospholipase_D-nuclease N-terminal